jgi:PAS domain S-box-containing protein
MVDGIIVINDRGLIETFNRGAERLFGYPAGKVIGRNVSILMPSPDHERHDGYLARYLSTGDARIIGIGREVKGRRSTRQLNVCSAMPKTSYSAAMSRC